MSRAIANCCMLAGLIIGALFASFPVQAQTTWYVDDDAPNDPGPGDPTVSDPNENGTPEHPFDAIQEGIDAAVDGDTVLVLDGTYTGVGNRDLDFSGRLITVRSENGPENCVVDCESDGRGFCFHSEETADAVVDGLTITNGYTGTLGTGGGVHCANSSPTFANCVFAGNTTGGYGGGMCNFYDSNPTLTNCVFSGNTAYWGGGMYNDGGRPTLTNCVFSGNAAELDSGGMCNYNGGEPTLTNCVFAGNTGGGYGGGMCNFYDGNTTLTNCVFSGNTAYFGGGMLNHFNNPTLSNCIFSGNTAGGSGGAIANQGGSPTLANCILWGDTPDEVDVYTGDPMITYCNIEGGWTGEGNIDADPLFADPNNGDYHLSAGSPCIDAGCNWAVPEDAADLDGDGDTEEFTPLDLDGEGRFFDDPNTLDTGCGFPPIVDMGAYEFGDTGPQPCFGDFNGDRVVDLTDLATLLAHYGETEVCEGDLNCDGDVDLDDLAALLAVYRTTCD